MILSVPALDIKGTDLDSDDLNIDAATLAVEPSPPSDGDEGSPCVSTYVERYNAGQIHRHLSHLRSPAGCMEARVFNASREGLNWIVAGERYSQTWGGFYDDIPRLANDLACVKGVSAFITINPVMPDLLSRFNNRIGKMNRGGCTNDSQIVHLALNQA